jgi:ribosomal protein S15P/S13E
MTMEQGRRLQQLERRLEAFDAAWRDERVEMRALLLELARQVAYLTGEINRLTGHVQAPPNGHR